MKRKLLSISLLLAATMASLPVHAANDQITKVAAGKIINVYSNGQGIGLNGMGVLSGDFPSGTLNAPKTLNLVRYQVTAYPQASSDNAELCYYEPYQGSPALCISVLSGSTGTTNQFNNLRFGAGAQLSFRHQITGQPGTVHPSGQESVTWEYSY